MKILISGLERWFSCSSSRGPEFSSSAHIVRLSLQLRRIWYLWPPQALPFHMAYAHRDTYTWIEMKVNLTEQNLFSENDNPVKKNLKLLYSWDWKWVFANFANTVSEFIKYDTLKYVWYLISLSLLAAL